MITDQTTYQLNNYYEYQTAWEIEIKQESFILQVFYAFD